MATTDRTEARAFLAVLDGYEARAQRELSHLSLRDRAALAVTAHRLAELSQEPGLDVDPVMSWMGPA